MPLANKELSFRKWGALVFYLCFAGFNLIYGFFGLGLFGLFLFVSEFRKKQVIRVEDGEIFIGSSIGRRAAQLEPVTAVHCDQIEYHLYSSKYEISIWTKRFPADFRALFDKKCEEISV